MTRCQQKMPYAELLRKDINLTRCYQNCKLLTCFVYLLLSLFISSIRYALFFISFRLFGRDIESPMSSSADFLCTAIIFRNKLRPWDANGTKPNLQRSVSISCLKAYSTLAHRPGSTFPHFHTRSLPDAHTRAHTCTCTSKHTSTLALTFSRSLSPTPVHVHVSLHACSRQHVCMHARTLCCTHTHARVRAHVSLL